MHTYAKEQTADMVRPTKVQVQAQLATGQLTLDQWDARRTEDGKVSVIDVIADITGKTHHHASNVYNRLREEQRISECEVRPLPPRSHLGVASKLGCTQRRSGGFSGASQETPVANAAEMISIVWQLPGTAEFRRNCAQTVVRYLGGDETLVDEIRTNRAAQEQLAATNPAHPARVFGEAVETETAASSATPAETLEERAQKIRRVRLDNDHMEVRNLQLCMQALTDIGESADDAMRWSYRDRVANLLRGEVVGSDAQEQKTIDAGTYLCKIRCMAANIVEKLRSKFGRIAARRKRERDGLARNAPLPTRRKVVNGQDTDVVLYQNPQDMEVLDGAYAELLGSTEFAEATALRASGQRAQSSQAGHQSQQIAPAQRRIFFPRPV
jgi:hypothetical protein